MRTEQWIEDWGKGFDDKKRCSRCVYDENTPNIYFDENGVCNYCHQWDQMDRQHPTGEAGWKVMERLADKINSESKGKKPNVVVGVSGGCDSSYTLHVAKKLGLRPLAVHYDNTWNSEIAVMNIRNVLAAMDVELYTHVVDNKEADDMFRAFFLAGAASLDAPTNLGLAATHYRAALKHNIKYIFDGHSFRTEGIAPLGMMYFDDKYIRDVHSQYGTRKLKTYPHLNLAFQFRCMAIAKIKRIRPLWYVDYTKEDVKKFLVKEYGWQWYGGHHLENRIPAFKHTYWMPRGFNTDTRVLGYAGLVRSGQMTRDEAIAKLKSPPNVDFELVDLFKKRLDLSDKIFEQVMNGPKRNHLDFKTYKPIFERLRPLIKIAAERDLVPWSFYLKYACKQDEQPV